MHPPEDSSSTVVYLVSRFASEANRRLFRVLSLASHVLAPVVVQEKHSRNFRDIPNVTIGRGIRPGHILNLMGLRRLGASIDYRLYFPSPSMQFARRAARVLAPRIRRDFSEKRSVTVVTFIPPHDVLETGRLLKQSLPGIRWVIDCQILWALDEHYQQSIRPAFTTKMREFERSRLNAADCVIVESDGVKEEMQRLYHVPGDRVQTLANAYDDCDARPLPQRDWGGSTDSNSSRPFVLSFLGSCFKPPKVPGDRLLKALDFVVRCGIDLRLRVVGDKLLDRFPDRVAAFHWVERIPRCAHEEAVRHLADSDALLLFLANTPWTRVLMHAKLPYYLASGIPIIAIVPQNSNTADIISRTGGGIVIDSCSDWGAELLKCLSDWNSRRQAIQRRPDEIARFAWSTIAPDWEKCLLAK